jgi:hypothetical protein
LNARYESLLTSEVSILNVEKTSMLYTLKVEIRKLQIIIYSTSTNAIIEEATLHLLKNRIDTTIDDSPIALNSLGLLKRGDTWESAVLKMSR